MVAAAARAAGLFDATVAADPKAAFGRVVEDLAAADVVLVKASRGLALNTVADQIVAHTRPAKRNEDPA